MTNIQSDDRGSRRESRCGRDTIKEMCQKVGTRPEWGGTGCGRVQALKKDPLLHGLIPEQLRKTRTELQPLSGVAHLRHGHLGVWEPLRAQTSQLPRGPLSAEALDHHGRLTISLRIHLEKKLFLSAPNGRDVGVKTTDVHIICLHLRSLLLLLLILAGFHWVVSIATDFFSSFLA